MAFRWSCESAVVDHKDLQANTMAIDYSGKFVVLAGRRNVAIIDIEKPHEVVKRISRSQQKYDVMTADWNPNYHMGHTFALAVGEKAEILHWRNGGLSTETMLKAHTRAISDLHWHRTEPNFLVTCSIDTFLHIWDVRETRKPVISLSAIAGSSCVKWNPINPNYLASGHDLDMRIWDRRKSNQPLRYINAHLQKIHGLDWSPNNENRIVSSSSDSTVKFFDITNPRASEMQITLQNPVWRACFTPFGEGIVTVIVPPLRRGDNSLLLWSMTDLANPVHTFVGHSDVVLEFDWRVVDTNMSDVQLVTWSRDNSLRIWRLDPQILKLCGHSFDEEDVVEAVEVDFSDTDTLLGSMSCQDEPLTGTTELDDYNKVPSDYSPSSSSPYLHSSILNDRLKREPPKTLALHNINVERDPYRSPIASFSTSQSASNIKLTDSTVSTPSLPPTTPNANVMINQMTELSTLSLVFEKTPDTSIEIIKKEELKQCLVNVVHGNFVAFLEITLPPNYPKIQAPLFRFGPKSNIDNISKKELLKVLKSTATHYQKKRRNCLEPCIKLFVTQLKALLSEDNPNVIESGLIGATMNNSSFFPLLYGGQQDYSIPFPRTSGARFGSSGILVCFTRPSHRQSGSRSSRAEPSTPRSLSALGALSTNLYPPLPNTSSSTSKYNNMFYSNQTSSMDKPVSISMYYNQDKSRSHKPKRGKSDNENNKVSKSGMITIYDISKFIPVSKDLAANYVLDEFDKIGSCHKNLEAAINYGRKDIAQVWSVAASILSLNSNYGEKEGHPWAHHPLARKLATSIINHYMMKHDIQTAALLSCILGNRPLNDKIPTAAKKGKISDSSSNHSLLDRLWRKLRPVLRRTTSGTHADIPRRKISAMAKLESLGFLKTSSVQKLPTGGSPYNTIHGTNTDGFDVGCIIRHNRSNSEGSLAEVSRSIAENSPAVTKDSGFKDHRSLIGFLDPEKSTMYDNMRKAYSEMLYRWDLLKQKALVDKYRQNVSPLQRGIDFQIECFNCYQSSPTPQCIHCKHYGFLCSVCTLSVRGSSFVCIVCGHGGHSLHLIDWFQDHSNCPTGCGCECLVEMEELFCNS